MKNGVYRFSLASTAVNSTGPGEIAHAYRPTAAATSPSHLFPRTTMRMPTTTAQARFKSSPNSGLGPPIR